MRIETIRTVLILTTALGCASSRGTLDIAVPVPPNPIGEVAFQVPVVEDARIFQASPPDPSIPSLKNAEEIRDAVVTSRAIARKRGGYGMAMGDILLPEGRAVQDLARDAIIRGLRSAGHPVLMPGDPGYADALPLAARIDQLWAWLTPGFWAMAIEFETRMHLTSEFAPLDGEDVRGYILLKSAAVSSEKWRSTIDRGLQDFSSSLEKILAEARARPTPAEDPVEACFRRCKDLTQRSDAECFDTCR
jgi:hypothetical protein